MAIDKSAGDRAPPDLTQRLASFTVASGPTDAGLFQLRGRKLYRGT